MPAVTDPAPARPHAGAVPAQSSPGVSDTARVDAPSVVDVRRDESPEDLVRAVTAILHRRFGASALLHAPLAAREIVTLVHGPEQH